MAKKKKTSLKPVARGFATTSVAKKPNPVEVVEEEASEDTLATSDTLPQQPDGSSENQPDHVVLDTEERSLQDCVDKYQDRVEKEIMRTLKAIEQERRFADTLPTLEMDTVYVDQILKLVLSEPQVSPLFDHPREDPEDKLIPKIGITYGVLRRLGLPDDVAERCLRSIRGIELNAAFDWLFAHYDVSNLRAKSRSSLMSESSHLLPTTPPQYAPPSIEKQTSRLNALSIPFVPRPPSSLASSTVADSVSELSSGTLTPITLAPDDDSSDEDLTASYVKLKLRIDDLTSNRKPTETHDAVDLAQLRKRLQEVQSDYMFEQAEAERVYRQERRVLNETRLQDRLRGVAKASPAEVRTPTPPQPPTSESRPTEERRDVFDDACDDDEPGGLLELLQDMPETESTPEGTTRRVRDLSLPKHWSGKTPRVLLLETTHKLDRYAIVEFRSISGPSRAKRATVRIRWKDGRLSEWSMEDVACHDDMQAEQYIAAVALHSLTFPPADGFAVGNTTMASVSTSFRLLPPIFRDLWREFEDKRKAEDDGINRKIWGRLKTLLNSKVAEDKALKKPSSEPTGPSDRGNARQFAQSELSSAQIMASFQARQAGHSYQEMLIHRNKLPIAAYRDIIVDTLENNQILVLSGETGCGKSTQLPAFILEDQLSRGRHCKIYCTEPRRISAISLAQRVSQELGEPPGAVGTLGSIVGYSIRLESNTSRTTRLAYVTNGIALRMLESGSGQGGHGTAFDEVTHVIIDEVHERSIESDFMLIVLKSLLKQRPDLKVVLMSATLDADKISNYFDGCPVLQVPGRTFPVEVQYLEDAIELTHWEVDESSPYAIRGKDKYSRGKRRQDWSEDATLADEDLDDDDATAVSENVKLEKRYSPSTAATINLLDERLVPYELIVRLLEFVCLEPSHYNSFSSAILVFMQGMGEIRRLHELLTSHPVFGAEDNFTIYPLHSSIASDQQAAVFNIPPPGVRKIVIATNIAETGITIPDITCVIDTGRQREMRFDEKRQLSRLVETYVARSNAAQRRGRAGRVQPGICFHLFTKARHDSKMAEHPDPEMMRLSLSDLALRIKIMKVKLGSSIEDVLSRALDPPSSINVQRAVSALVEARALTPTEDITPMGRLLSKLPTDVHLGKFLLVAAVFKCLDPALTIAATLNSKSPFLTPFGKVDEAHRKKLSFRTENSDFLTLHNAFSAWRRACGNGMSAERKFCRDCYLSHQNLQQIEELRQQFLGYLIDSSFISVNHDVVLDLNRARFSGRGRVRFVNVPSEYNVNSVNPAVVNAALAAGLYPKLLSVTSSKDGKDKLVTITNNQAVAFHPSSVNFGRKPRDFAVNYLSYFTIMQSKKMYAWETGPVDDLALVLLCGEPDFKPMADSVLLDRKVRYRIDARTSVALKHLRHQITTLLASQFRGDPLTESQVTWQEIAMLVLGKIKPKTEEKKQEIMTLVVNCII